MRLFSRPTGKSPASVNSLPHAGAAAAATVTRRIEITVEREWSEAVFRAQEDPAPVAAADEANDAEGSGRLW